MKYALVNEEPQEALPGLSGKCKSCGDPTIAKCGKVKIWHWAHIGKRMCDPWWENETEWHRAWKGLFPKENQEIVMYAENGEKHIADVKMDHGYVIEFQHSHIKPQERQDRENFYKKMIWIVDGTRRSRDKNKFINVLKNSHSVGNQISMRRLQPFFDECALLRDWVDSRVPVFFDFGEDMLWGLLAKTTKYRYVVNIERNKLIQSLYPVPPGNGFEVLLEEWYKHAALDHRYWQERNLLTSIQRFQPRESNHSIRQRMRHRL